jgi:heptosyltransferase-2
MSKALVIIKSMGLGDIIILSPYIDQISKHINKPVVVLAQKNTHANAIFKHSPYVENVIELNKKGFFSIIDKIRPKEFDQTYIFSDSIRLYLISRFSGIKKNFHYAFFSKKGKNFFRTAKNFTQDILKKEIESQPKIYCNSKEVEEAKQKFNISNNKKNIVAGISASGPTKRWDVKNYIKLFEEINKRFPSRFFLAGGPNDENIIQEVLNSSIGENCLSFSKMSISQTIPIISLCDVSISNDTGFGHISSALGLKSLFLFMDSPPLSYGVYSKNISIIIPQGESIDSCSHNTKGKNKISFNEVLNKALELLN